ncbi:hypothetical protein E3U25_01970 (plasmid) [Paracoccus versutus]|uniref:Uncharacterized protein n=2 Tax=Paracoccus versutus TaxID=34007 RepID=A0A3D9XVU6_PARVE|nr:hypothetical protein BDD41_1782 [Paracoccus versutus]WGR54861.1 hypothetical protein E3U25_01970 [Paracoccus versutus]
MAPTPPIAPDIISLRDALRGLRYALRRGGETLSEIPVATLPEPAGRIAGAVLRQGGELAKGADQVVSNVAKRLLGSEAGPIPAMPEIISDSNSPERFAAACYTALKAALRQLNFGEALIVESAARLAYRRIAPTIGNLPEPVVAAELTVQLLDLHAIHGAEDAEALAVFAVLLWLQSDRADVEELASLEASVDLAKVLRDDVLSASAARDKERLGKLYAEFINHV